MATYLQGVTDYIPQIQPFTPDYNFYAQSLQFGQGSHDAARKQLSNIYGSLLNAPLTREDNSEARDKFFKTIDQDIKKMAGMDLSLQQNVHAAKGVFNQMLDNKSIVKDMVWTKKFGDEMKRSDGFKNCVDPEKCGGSWWEGGDRALQYARQEFINASADEAMNMGVQAYVPYQDVTKKALELAKEADLNVTVDQVTGQWITTTKNGPQLIGKQLQSLFMGSIGKDPKVKEYYQTKASVERKDFMYSNKDQYGSLEAAEQAYIQEVAPVIEQYYNRQTAEMEDEVAQNEKKTAKIDKAMENAMPDKRTKMQRLRDEFQKRGDAYQSSLEESKQGSGQVQVAKRNTNYSGRQVDSMLAGMSLAGDINKSAEVLSYRNYEQTVAVNPYGMESVKQKNRMMFEKYKHHNDMELAYYKNQLDGEAETAAATGGGEANVPETVSNILGTAWVGDMDSTSEEFKQRGQQAFEKDRDYVQQAISGNEMQIMDDVISRVKGAAEGGDAQAKEDYVNIINNYAASMNANKEATSTSTEEMGARTMAYGVGEAAYQILAEKINNATTLDEKYAIAKQAKTNWGLIAGGQVDQMYEKTVLPMFVRGKAGDENNGNEVLRDYLAPVWENNQDLMRGIQTKNFALEKMDELYANESKSVIDSVNGDSKYSVEMKDAFASYVDDKGHVVDEKTFIQNMAAKGYSQQEASALWNQDEEMVFNDPDQWLDATGNLINTVVGTTIGAVQSVFGGGGDIAYSPYGTRIGKENVHDMWKEAFTEHADISGDRGFLGLTGGGDKIAQGQRFSSADPAQYKSNAIVGVVGSLKDGLNNSDAVFALGGFGVNVPESDPEEQAKFRKMANQLIIDIGSQTKTTDGKRPMMDITYTQIAGSDDNMMGVNIKLSEAYRLKYKGSANAEGMLADERYATEGFTMYIPKDKATNLFYTGSQETALEKMMSWTGKMDFDAYPDYTKNTKLVSDPVTGNYKFSGMVQVDIDENGQGVWDYVERDAPFGKDLNELVAYYDKKLADTARMNRAKEEKWKLENK